tara:strand:+ start:192 stop:482 length:291 start_codon:yes stop_codon:yes gene_type:complete
MSQQEDFPQSKEKEYPYPHNIIVKILGQLTEHTEHFVLGFKLNGESKVYTVTDDHYASLGMIPTILEDVQCDLESVRVEEELKKEFDKIRKLFEDS